MNVAIFLLLSAIGSWVVATLVAVRWWYWLDRRLYRHPTLADVKQSLISPEAKPSPTFILKASTRRKSRQSVATALCFAGLAGFLLFSAMMAWAAVKMDRTKQARLEPLPAPITAVSGPTAPAENPEWERAVKESAKSKESILTGRTFHNLSNHFPDAVVIIAGLYIISLGNRVRKKWKKESQGNGCRLRWTQYLTLTAIILLGMVELVVGVVWLAF